MVSISSISPDLLGGQTEEQTERELFLQMVRRRCEENLPLAGAMAKKYRGRAQRVGIPWWRLVHASRLALFDASRSFDPSRGFTFSTYAGDSCCKAICGLIRDTILEFRGQRYREEPFSASDITLSEMETGSFSGQRFVDPGLLILREETFSRHLDDIHRTVEWLEANYISGQMQRDMNLFRLFLGLDCGFESRDIAEAGRLAGFKNRARASQVLDSQFGMIADLLGIARDEVAEWFEYKLWAIRETHPATRVA